MSGPLPFERVLWRGRPVSLRPRLLGERYYLTEFRLVRIGADVAELALHDVGDVVRTESPLDRIAGTSSVIVHSRSRNTPPIILSSVRRGSSLAAGLELLSADRHAAADPDAVRAALAWEPRAPAVYREAAGAVAALLVAVTVIVFGLRGHTVVVTYAHDDAIAPDGVKRERAEVMRFMEHEVMPWARSVLGRIKGSPDRITCNTCHGADASGRAWIMPAVAALPEPLVRERGFEIFSASMDTQMRNAIYGYTAESENSAKAAYMREVVMPGMAALLHRPAYDFTRSYEYNRSRNALGCYHCHRVK